MIKKVQQKGVQLIKTKLERGDSSLFSRWVRFDAYNKSGKIQEIYFC